MRAHRPPDPSGDLRAGLLTSEHDLPAPRRKQEKRRRAQATSPRRATEDVQRRYLRISTLRGLPDELTMALLLRRTSRALLRRGSTWSRSTEPVPPAFLTSLDNPQTYFDSSELRAVGGLETQPQSLNAETEKVLHDEAWRGVAKKRGLLFESMVERDIATQGAFVPAAVMRSRHP